MKGNVKHDKMEKSDKMKKKKRDENNAKFSLK